MDDEVIKALQALADFMDAEFHCTNREVTNEPLSPKLYERGMDGMYRYVVKQKP